MVEPDVGLVDQALLARASMRYLSHNCALPCRIGDGALTVILADPTNGYVIADLERIFEVPVRPCCATEGSILAALDTLRLLREGKGQSAAASLQYHEMRDIDVSRESGEGAVAVLDSLLQRAIQMRASDLHIEPLESKVRIRLRVDGGLVALTELPLGFAPQLISRVKVLAGMDITERRHHQDGRIGVRFDGGEVDIRVSSYNSVFGETLVLRLLDRRRGLVALEDLGMEPRVLATLREIVLRGSSGLVLVTGRPARARRPRSTPSSTTSMRRTSRRSAARIRWSTCCRA